MVTRLVACDGNYYLWRAFSVAVRNRDPAHVERNVLTLFLSMIVSDLVVLRATHAVVTFDGPNCWRYDIFPEYKAGRHKKREPIMVSHPKYPEPVQVDITPGAMSKSAKQLIRACGIHVIHKARLESDDLLGSVASQFQGDADVIIATRDKDMAGLVNAKVKVYWPSEKKMLGVKEVKDHYGVHPFQIRDFLSLTGDKVDGIPGVPGVASKTASAMLGDDTLKNRLKRSAKLRARLSPHYTSIALAQKLTTLKIIDLKETLDDLVPSTPDGNLLSSLVWSVPKGLASLKDVSQSAKLKGLFSSIRNKRKT
jgi:DNA polymerase-1